MSKAGGSLESVCSCGNDICVDKSEEISHRHHHYERDFEDSHKCDFCDSYICQRCFLYEQHCGYEREWFNRKYVKCIECKLLRKTKCHICEKAMAVSECIQYGEFVYYDNTCIKCLKPVCDTCQITFEYNEKIYTACSECSR